MWECEARSGTGTRADGGGHARLDRTLPVVVIGDGPVGLAAAAHLLARGLRALVVEAGPSPATAIREWGHVRMFSPWRLSIDPVARTLLEATGWHAPEPDAYPTGADLVTHHIEPLTTALAEAGVDLRFSARVVGVSRRHHDRLHDGNRAAGLGRAAAPFVLHVMAPDGRIIEAQASVVIDASGTWSSPDPAGAHGLLAPGEIANFDRISYGIPDILGTAKHAFAGATTLVVGGGHSAP